MKMMQCRFQFNYLFVRENIILNSKTEINMILSRVTIILYFSKHTLPYFLSFYLSFNAFVSHSTTFYYL